MSNEQEPTGRAATVTGASRNLDIGVDNVG
jgi:hypothetical protein